MITEVTVISSDGVPFTVQSWVTIEAQALAVAAAEIRFAVTQTAAELSKFGSYHRKPDMVELDFVGLEPTVVPRIAGPLERRAAFALIKGGKTS
jgi:hypothetical protein